ncbi:MAG TPA: hypothetical protein VH208_12140, partial [Myxococcaceae bacterium]|nr:hypothetical protein [Myxococcaceae bacterium]
DLLAFLGWRVDHLRREVEIASRMPAIVKTDFAHRITHGGRSVTPHRECWGARTADGVWSFERVEEPGTPWLIYHLPSLADGSYLGVVASETTLDGCRRAVASGWAEQELGRRKAEEAARQAS